ncbi:MAG: DMT family transporter [Verrucomicrobiota bacterium]|nr:DMT family transporter [Verrucomicrobiota bacterium]
MNSEPPPDSAVVDRRYRGLRSPWLQVAISTLSVAIAELFMKRGADATAHVAEEWGWTGLTTLASPLVWVGMLFTFISFITWLYAIKHLPLSVAFPASQAVHVLVPISSWLVLGELISPLRWCGIALVLAGLALVARPVAQLEEKL